MITGRVDPNSTMSYNCFYFSFKDGNNGQHGALAQKAAEAVFVEEQGYVLLKIFVMVLVWSQRDAIHLLVLVG